MRTRSRLALGGLVFLASTLAGTPGCIGENEERGPATGSTYPEGGRLAVDPPTPGIIHITFDDGPGPYTPDILDVLDKHKVVATFFMVGVAITNYRDMVTEVQRRGHQVANHSFYHEAQPSLDRDVFEHRLNAMHLNIDNHDNGRLFFRFPFGQATPRELNWLQEIQYDGQHYVPVGWNIDSQDWSFRDRYPREQFNPLALSIDPECDGQPNPFPKDFVGLSLMTARRVGGGIMLFHDIQQITHDFLDAILTGLEDPAPYWASLPQEKRDEYLKFYACKRADPDQKFKFVSLTSGNFPSFK